MSFDSDQHHWSRGLLNAARARLLVSVAVGACAAGLWGLNITQAAPTASAAPSAGVEKRAEKPPEKPPEKPTTKSEEPLTIVSRVVGEVGTRAITTREVAINEAITQALSGLPPDRATEKSPSKKVLVFSDPAFSGHLIRVMDEWTVFFEASDIDAQKVDKSDVARMIKSVSEFWKDQAAWEKLEASPSEIRETVERKIVIQAFERLKSDTSVVNISDAEALQYYKKNRLRFGSLPFENFKDNIKAALVKGQTERRLMEWRAVLRRKYRVRNLLGT